MWVLLSSGHCFNKQMGFRVPIAGVLRVAEAACRLMLVLSAKQTHDGSRWVLNRIFLKSWWWCHFTFNRGSMPTIILNCSDNTLIANSWSDFRTMMQSWTGREGTWWFSISSCIVLMITSLSMNIRLDQRTFCFGQSLISGKCSRTTFSTALTVIQDL